MLLAAWKNQVGCMEVLTEAGADLDKASGHGNAPLIQAAANGHTAAVEWLLGRGADWRLAGNDDHPDGGKTALDCAKYNGEVEAVAALEAWIAEHGSVEEDSTEDLAAAARKEREKQLKKAKRPANEEAKARADMQPPAGSPWQVHEHEGKRYWWNSGKHSLCECSLPPACLDAILPGLACCRRDGRIGMDLPIC